MPKASHSHFNLIICGERETPTESGITDINAAFGRDTLMSVFVRLAGGAVNIGRRVSKNSPRFCARHNLLGLQVKSTISVARQEGEFPPCLKAGLCCC